MGLWRIFRRVFADLSGEGARLHGGRWTSPGRQLVYCADSAALAILEVRVHLDLTWDLLPEDFVLMEIETSSASIETATAVASERVYGDAWLASGRSALLRVPSAIVPEDRNVLINPAHASAVAIKRVSTRPFAFDERLWLPRL